MFTYLSGECFAGDNEERGLGVQLLQRLRHVGPVDVRHKVNLENRKIRKKREKKLKEGKKGKRRGDILSSNS